MGKISDYITVLITRDSQGVSRASFKVPLILSEVSEFYDRTKEYNSLASLAEDFSTASDVYKQVTKMLSQNPKPSKFKIGRKYADVNAKQEFIPNFVPTAGDFTITLGALTTAVIAYDANAAAIKAALELLATIAEVTVIGDLTALTGFTVEFTGADTNTHFATMTADATGLTTCTSISVTVDQYGSATETYPDALAGIVAADDEWYWLLATTRTKADIIAIAADIEARKKYYNAGTNDADVITSTSDDIASTLQTSDYDRTAVWYSGTSDNYLDAGVAGKCAAQDVGSLTWMYQDLSGITLDTLSASERAYALSKNANIYTSTKGFNVTEKGVAASDEYIDVIVGTDYLQTRMEENTFEALAKANKIPFTQAGISALEGKIRATVDDGIERQILTKNRDKYGDLGYNVEMPKIADIATADKAARTLNNCYFSADLAGAIHYAGINGIIQI